MSNHFIVPGRVLTFPGRHDTMAENMGLLSGETFESKHNPFMMEAKRKFMDYAVALHRAVKSDSLSTVPNNTEMRPDIGILLNKDSYPCLPSPPTDQDMLLKTDLEVMMRSYLNAHYSKVLLLDFG